MALQIPESSQIPEEWEISFDLNVLKELMRMSDELLADIILENVNTIKRAATQRNTEIDINLLYKLYFFANEHWLSNSDKPEKHQKDVDKVRCTRRLRDACKKEITRRSLM